MAQVLPRYLPDSPPCDSSPPVSTPLFGQWTLLESRVFASTTIHCSVLHRGEKFLPSSTTRSPSRLNDNKALPSSLPWPTPFAMPVDQTLVALRSEMYSSSPPRHTSLRVLKSMWPMFRRTDLNLIARSACDSTTCHATAPFVKPIDLS